MQILENFLELLPRELIYDSAILALVFRVVWSGTSKAFNWVRQIFNRRTRIYKIELGEFRPQFDKKIDLKCLVVRYGADSYLQSLANERDKFDGRLQNKVIPISMEKTEKDTALFVIKLPVHQRIGTQFKCFADIEDPEDFKYALQVLESYDCFHGISKSSSQFKHRIYFLLSDFGTIKTVDGIENNICYPV